MTENGWGQSWSEGLGLKKPADEKNVSRWQRYLTGHWGTLTKGSLIKRALLWLFIAGVVGAAVGAGVYFLAPGAAILGVAAFLAWGIASGMAALGMLLLVNAFATRPGELDEALRDMEPAATKGTWVHWVAFVFKLALIAILLGPIMALAWPLMPGIAGTTLAAPAETLAAIFTGLGASQFVSASMAGVLSTLAVVSGFFLLVGLGRMLRAGARYVFDMIPDEVGPELFGPEKHQDSEDDGLNSVDETDFENAKKYLDGDGSLKDLSRDRSVSMGGTTGVIDAIQKGSSSGQLPNGASMEDSVISHFGETADEDPLDLSALDTSAWIQAAENPQTATPEEPKGKAGADNDSEDSFEQTTSLSGPDAGHSG